MNRLTTSSFSLYPGQSSVLQVKGRIRNPSPWATLMVLLACTVGFGCNLSEGTGSLAGTLFLPDCPDLSGPFALELDFLGVEKVGSGILEIRAQNGGEGMELSDGIVFQIFDEDVVLSRRGRRLPFHPFEPALGSISAFAPCADPLDPETEVDSVECPLIRLSLFFHRTCPDGFRVPLLTAGSVAFSHFGTEPGNRMAAHFTFDVLHGRTGQVLGTELEGSFDFVVRPGQPFVRFVE